MRLEDFRVDDSIKIVDITKIDFIMTDFLWKNGDIVDIKGIYLEGGYIEIWDKRRMLRDFICISEFEAIERVYK